MTDVLAETIPEPTNPVSGQPFHKGNLVRILTAAMDEGYRDGRWATYRQWQSIGRQVRKGEHGVPCLLPTIRKDEDGRTMVSGKPRRGYTVFAYEQTDEMEQERD